MTNTTEIAESRPRRALRSSVDRVRQVFDARHAAHHSSNADRRQCIGVALRHAAPSYLARFAIAGTWLYHGLWLKLIFPTPRQASIVESVPGLGGDIGQYVLVFIGLVETALAIWVLSGFLPTLAAFGQTMLLVSMNAGGLLWGRTHIADPMGMVVQNFVFVTLIWSDLVGRREHHDRC